MGIRLQEIREGYPISHVQSILKWSRGWQLCNHGKISRAQKGFIDVKYSYGLQSLEKGVVVSMQCRA